MERGDSCYTMGMFRRRALEDPRSPAEPYLGLRMSALEVTEATIGTAPPEHPDVLGAVIDIPSTGGMASVIALADGTTSMYTSTGGGTIGAGSHPSVAQATRVLLTALQGLIDLFPADERVDLPSAGLVQVTLVTSAGRRRANVPAAAFWGDEPSSVIELVAAVHGVISAIRAIEPPS